MEKLRTRLILDYLRQKKRCSLVELMDRFHVSSATIHRDVQELSRRDAVTIVRGGIVFNSATKLASDADNFSERVVANRRGKIAAAIKALHVIVEGDIIFLDSSTTVYELSLLLREAEYTHLTIVTNSLSIMSGFRKFPREWVLIGLGGNYDVSLNSILGSAALAQISSINITKAFVSGFGLDDRNVTTNHERQAELIRKVLDSAEKRFLLIDKSKFGRTGLYRLAPKGAFDAVFSDR